MSIIHADGSIERTIDDTLVWAVTWESSCVAVGPAVSTTSSAPAPTVAHCANLVLIDADSGNVAFDGSASLSPENARTS